MRYAPQADLLKKFETLISANSPSFIFIRDLSSADVACSTLKTVLETLAQNASTEESESSRPIYAFANSVACFTPRILFDSTLRALISCYPEREARVKRELLENHRNDSFDDFLHNIRLLFSEASMLPARSYGDNSGGHIKLVLIFERAERLRDTLPRLIHPLSRLQELTGLNLATIFLSDAGWDTITPVPGTLTDPYMMDVDGIDVQDVIEQLYEAFPKDVTPDAISMYNPSLEQLFCHFVEAVYNVCSPFTSDTTEFAYIIAVRWPGFVAPVLEDWKAQEGGPYLAPSEEARMRLMRLFNSSLMNAVENLYTRSTERTEWSAENSFPPGFRLSQSLGAQLPTATDAPDTVPKLSVLSMFIVLAAFLASYNPAKTDYRMFGRGVDEKSRRRRKGGGTRKMKPGTVAKLPQRLVGPMSFTYDRLVAILGSLLREYDELRQTGDTFEDASEIKAEIDVYRVQLSGSIRELVSLQLLHRSTAQEKLEAPSFRCGVGYEQALVIARKLGIPLNDLMWEPN